MKMAHLCREIRKYRSGAALIVAALIAKGKSEIYNVEQIDRGYEKINEKLKKLGAEIERVEN